MASFSTWPCTLTSNSATTAWASTSSPRSAPDGSLTLVPDTSFEAARKRLGTRPGTLADFEAEYGPVNPTDGEG